MSKLGDAARRLVGKAREKLAEPAYAGCWACSMGRCGQAPKDNTCACCRGNHTGIR